jgi:hypothetical protein
MKKIYVSFSTSICSYLLLWNAKNDNKFSYYGLRKKMIEINNSTVPSKFSPFEHVTPTNKSFSWKISILNTIMFCLIAGVDTNNCLLLKANHANTPDCPLGYYVLLFTIPLVLGNYLLLSRLNRWILQILLPYLFTIGLGCFVSLINFTPPLPNIFQMVAFVLFPIPGLIASLIRYYTPHAQMETHLDDVDLQARINWVNENSNMWRTLAITSLIPTFVFIVFWYTYLSTSASQIFAEEKRGYVHGLIALQATGIIFYVFFGPIYECFRKAEHIRNMLLVIKKKGAKEI